MQIQVRKYGDVNVVELSGRLTIGAGDVALRERFGELLDSGARKFVFNLVNVPFVDSAGLGETVACHKRASEKEAVIRVVLAPRGRPEELFVLTSLDKVFDIYNSEEEALASFSG